MTVGELRRLIGKMPDNVPILKAGMDHSYRIVNAWDSTALRDKRGEWTEDHGEKLTPEKEYGKRLRALIIG